MTSHDLDLNYNRVLEAKKGHFGGSPPLEASIEKKFIGKNASRAPLFAPIFLMFFSSFFPTVFLEAANRLF